MNSKKIDREDNAWEKGMKTQNGDGNSRTSAIQGALVGSFAGLLM